MTVPPGPAASQGELVQAALIWAHSGCSVIPIRADGTKRPAVEWKTYQDKPATPEQVEYWFYPPNEGYRNLGIGVICGKVSGNLEMLELEGRATSEETLEAIGARCDELGVGSTLSTLMGEDGYCELTPSGGIHLLYRVTDHEVPGNTKVARRPATWEELEAKPDDKLKVLAETRGEGGYVVVAPTGGTVHATGEPWQVLAGQIGQIRSITWADRNLIHQAIHEVLDEMPEPTKPVIPTVPKQRTPGAGTRPGDDYNDRASWDGILEPHGWQIHHISGNTVYWTRPGKSKRDGHSATTGHAGTGANDRLFVMSSATEFETDTPLSKFFVYAHYEHRGNMAEATKALAAQGYGDQAPRFQPPNYDAPWQDWQPEPNSNVDSPAPKPAPQLPRTPRGRRDFTISGAANRFVREQGHFFWYVTEEKTWRAWNGTVWERDDMGAGVSLAFEAMTEDMMDEAEALMQQAATDPDKLPMAKALTKHVNAVRNASRSNVLALIAQQRLISAAAFDADPRYLNLRNGTYDLVDDKFLAHDPRHLLTKIAGVDYDPDAKAPRSEAFFGELLENEPMREFVMQGLAYSLTGEADRKAMFILQGVSNSGKTQLTELAQGIFGDYATSVSPGTFTKKREHGPNPELHNMRGTRFVYTSETSYDIQLDEELVKRVTGKDTMNTRTLYEKPQQWIPQCAVWIATNNLPRFGSDSEAMWRRVKTVRFTNVFTDDGQSGHVAQPNIGRTLAKEEGAGLFNLLLAALRRYRAAGRLVEPQELKESVAQHRQETDPVSQWVAAVEEKGHLVRKPGARVTQTTLRRAYSSWCTDEGFQPLAAQRFGIALGQIIDCEKQRSNGDTWVVGWEWSGPTWITGQSGDWRNRAVD